jgi:hypothetical protein
VRVADSFGNAVPGQIVDFRVTSGQAGLLAAAGAAPSADAQVVTGTDGTAGVSLVAGAVAGPVQVTASVPGSTIAPLTFGETLKPGVPARLIMLQQPATKAQATIILGRQPKVQVADSYGNAVPLAGVTVVAFATIDCSSGGVCGDRLPSGAAAMTLDRAPRRGAATRPAFTRRSTATRTARGVSRLSIPTTITRTQSVSDTFPQGVGGTTQVATDANGVASFNDLSLNLQVMPAAWEIGFEDENESLSPAISDDISLSPGPITSIVAQLGQDTLYFTSVSDTLHPAAVVIDPVGNGIPGVTVTWSVVTKNGTLDSLTTTTDANGVASPGNWLLLAGVAGPFEVLATPNASKVENAPLPIFAVQLLQ